ncbi:recombinase family protein [Intestinibacter sp.]|uniref:recombinase family protein n=1 Tax=Intestinibacter sp. TaxID=1965304 RepID=UPI00307DE91C
MNYGYVRVSTTTQNIARQMDELYKMGISAEAIFIDKQSGKDFDRSSYKILKNKLKKGDLLIIKSIDRLGRNYDMIINEWQEITKVIEADIFVIDFPLLDTRVETQNLVGKFISDIVLQVLSFVAQNERENIRQRQAEGIKIAKAKGVHMGRPKYKLPDNFDEIVKKFHNKEITNTEAAKILNMTKGTFLKYSKTTMN